MKNTIGFMRPLLLFVLLVFSVSLYAQTTYYSRASSTWNLNTTWSTVSHLSAINTGTFPVAGDIVNIGGNFTVTINAAAACAAINISDGSALTIGAATLVVSGTTTVGAGTSGTLSITSTTGTKTFAGLVTINNGGTWSNTFEAVTFQGGIVNNGTFTAGTGAQTFNTNSQALTGTFIIPSVIVAGGAVTLTNNNSLTVNAALSGSGRITQGTNAVLNIGGASAITNMTATASGNTVNYTGAAQTVHNNAYENLGLSGSGVKTLQAGTTLITGDLILSGTVSTTAVTGLTIGGDVTLDNGTSLTAGAFTHTVGGDWTNNGSTFVETGSTINLNGASQSIGGSASTPFNNLSFASSGTKTLGVTTAIGGTFSVGTGVVADLGSITTHTANTLILGGALQTSGTWGGTGSGATNINSTYFASNPGQITIATGDFTYYSRSSTTGDWNDPNTWSTVGHGSSQNDGTFPGATNFAIIGGNSTVTVTADAICSALSFDAGTSVTNTLTVNSGNTLTVSGAVTIPQTITSGSNIMDVGAGNLVVGSISFTTGSPGGTGHQMTISTGTATISGNITGTGTSSDITFSGAGLLQLGGSFYTAANGTLTTFAGSTVEYMGAAQSVESHSYNNLTLSGTGNKTLAATTTVGGNLVIADNPTLTIGAVTLVVSGTTTVGAGTSGTLSITSTTGTKTFTGLVTINNGGTWSNTFEAVTFQGGIVNNGTFTAGTGAQTFNTNSQALTGTFIIPSVIVAGGAVTLTNNNSLTVNAALSGSGRITQGTNAVLNIGGASAITNMTAAASGNTVNYTGAAQTVHNNAYENLGLSGSGVKTLQAGTTLITGDLILSGTVSTTAVTGLTIGGDVTLDNGTSLTAGAFTHTVGGDWTNNGSTFVETGSTINLNGASQSIGGSASTPFNNLSFASSGTKTLGVTTAIGGTFSVGTGVVADLGSITTHTANTLILGGALQTSGTWGGTGSGATNINSTYFASNPGQITIATGDFTYYSRSSTTGDWNDPNTWSTVGHGSSQNDGTFPGATNFAIIGGNSTVTVTADAICSALSFDAGTSVTNTLTVNSGNTLTVSGAVTIPQTITSGSNIMDVGAGNLVVGSISFTTGSPGGTGHQMTISTGTATISGNITGTGTSSDITFSGAGLLQLGGSFYTAANGTLTTFAGSTVEYMGAAQSVESHSYNNLTLSGTGNKTLAATTTVGGNLVIADNPTLTIGAVTLVVSGTTTVGAGTSGTLSITSTTGTKTFAGLVTINNGGTWSNTFEAVTFQGGIVNNGTFTAGTGAQTFNTNSQALTGTFIIPSVIVAGGAVTLTNNNSLTVNAALSGSGRITQGTNAVLNIGGASAITNMTAAASGNTVNYTGAAQTVHNNAYENLGLSGSGVKTLQAGTTLITGDLILSGTVSTTAVTGLTIGGDVTLDNGTSLTAGAFTHTVGGDWTNNGSTFVETGSTINLNGASQSIGGSASTPFNNLSFASSGTKTLGVTTAIGGTFSVGTGVVADLGSITTHTANTLILGGALQTSGTWGGTGSGATNINSTYFASNPGQITIATGDFTYYSRSSTTGDWNDPNTWSTVGHGSSQNDGTFPGATNFAIIGGNSTVTVTADAICSALSFDAGTSVTNTLTVNSGNTLTVSGAVTIPQTITSGSNIMDVGAGNLVVGSISFTTGSPGGTGHQMTISTGTATISGNITGTGTSSDITFSGAGLLQLGGSFYTAANGTLTTFAGSTVEYMGAAQSVESHSYNNLTLSGTGNKTLAATTTVGGNLVIADNPTLTIGAVTLVVSGTTTVGAGTSGTLSITSTTGTKTFTGLVTINNGGTWSNTFEAVTFQGGIVNNGTFTAGTGAQTFNTNSQALTGTFIIPSVIVAGGAVTLTNNNSLTVNAALSGSGRITQGTNAVLNIGGASAITNMTAAASGNTVNYTGAAQTVHNNAYENLGLSGSGVKTLQAGTTLITGDLILSGTVSTTAVTGLTIGGDVTLDNGTSLTAGAFTHTVGGDWINDGTFNNSNGTITFSGTLTQDIQGTSPTTFYNLNIAEGPANPDVSMDGIVNLQNVLTLSSGAILDADGPGGTGVLTLLSSADNPTADGSIASLLGSSAVTGNVTVQRHMAIEGANNARIYRYISSPVQSSPVSQIQPEIPVTGTFTGTSTCTGCGTNQSMFLYNESVITDTNGSGGNNFDDGYEDFPNAANSETLTPGRGYSIFVRGNIDPVAAAGSAKWDVRAQINSGNINFNSFTTFTSSTVVANDGWNLVGNPYPSTIDWDAPSGWTRTGLNDAIYMRDNGLLSPVYATYVGGVGINGGSRYIATGQAFFVKSDGGPVNFQATESVKAAGTQTIFFRQEGINDLIRVALKRDGITDETVVRFDEGATEGFDPTLDAYKLNNAVFNLSSVSGNAKYAINALAGIACSSSIQLDVSNVTPGTYQLELSQFDSFDPSMDLKLIDDFSGQSIDIRQNSLYEFAVTDDNKSYGNRFKISFEQGEINSSIIPEGDSGVCIGQSYSITLPTSESNVIYYATLGGTTISEDFTGTGSSLNLPVDASQLTDGENSILVYAKRPTCDATVTLAEPVNVVLDNVYNIQSVTEGTACQSGSVLLSASGAPTTGSYHWYESLSDEPIAGATGNSMQTPVLDKSKTYYVSAVNSFGCEGERKAVKAEVVKYEEVVISEVETGILSSSYVSGNVWYLNNTLIPGATNQTLAVSESGVYKVETSIGNCKSTSTREYSITGLESELAGSGISYYPNPVTDLLTVRVANSDNVTQVDLISNTGVRLESATVKNNEAIIDMRNHPSGIYLIKLIGTNNSVSTFKILRK